MTDTLDQAVKHIVMFSGGMGSYLAAKRVIAAYGAQNTTLLFADTSMEDEDLYRFLTDAQAKLDCPLVILKDGRTPWDVFFERRFLGNSRVDLCSRILKREPCTKWLKEHCVPEETRIYVGIDWSESHRYARIVERNKVWRYFAPLCDAPYLSPQQAKDELRADGLKLPRLYEEGFAHNNCGGFCVKAGQAHFANLLSKRPEAYAYHEGKEEQIRQMLDRDISIMTDRRGKVRKPMTLKVFRERKQRGEDHDALEWGGCGCFSGEDND